MSLHHVPVFKVLKNVYWWLWKYNLLLSPAFGVGFAIFIPLRTALRPLSASTFIYLGFELRYTRPTFDLIMILDEVIQESVFRSYPQLHIFVSDRYKSSVSFVLLDLHCTSGRTIGHLATAHYLQYTQNALTYLIFLNF
jgi:hypothetical protein